MLFVLMLSADW